MHTFATEAKRAWSCTILYPHAMLAHNQTTKSWSDMLMKRFQEEVLGLKSGQHGRDHEPVMIQRMGE